DFPRHAQIGIVPATGGEIRLLTTSLDRNCSPFPSIRSPAWDGDRVVFLVEEAGNVHMYAVAAEGSARPELLLRGEQVVTGFDVVDGRFVHSAATSTTLPELYAGEERLTEVGAPFGEARELVRAERFSASSADGSEVGCWIVKPAGYQVGTRYPTLLSIHGGPFTQYTTGFFDEFQVYAGAGYAVVYANPRGSSGYSEDWGRAIRGPSN